MPPLQSRRIPAHLFGGFFARWTLRPKKASKSTQVQETENSAMEILLQQIINGLVLGSMYALVALGYTMVYGIINLINFAIEKIAYRPLRNSPKLAPLITAIGMSILLQTLAMIIWKPNYKPYPTLLPAKPIQIGGAVITTTQIMILAVTVISLAILMYLVNYTRLGRAMRATAENPRVARPSRV